MRFLAFVGMIRFASRNTSCYNFPDFWLRSSVVEQRTHKPLVVGSNPTAATNNMNNISLDDFQKLELKIGKVISAGRVDGSDKLLKLQVDLGEEQRQILAGIAQFYEPKEVENKNFTFITNLEPRKMMGLESQGMMLCAEDNGKPVCLTTIAEVPAGSKIR